MAYKQNRWNLLMIKLGEKKSSYLLEINTEIFKDE